MYTETSNEKIALGLHKLTGSNRGLYYANEREETLTTIELEHGVTKHNTHYVYDVYEVPDARFPDAVKDSIVCQVYPCDAEHKILRKALAAIATKLDIYNDPDLAEFKAYNDFVEHI